MVLVSISDQKGNTHRNADGEESVDAATGTEIDMKEEMDKDLKISAGNLSNKDNDVRGEDENSSSMVTTNDQTPTIQTSKMTDSSLLVKPSSSDALGSADSVMTANSWQNSSIQPSQSQEIMEVSTEAPAFTSSAEDCYNTDVQSTQEITNVDDQVEEGGGAEDYVDDDGGVIRCICECDDDDGFTIQCDQCLVWQHCACFGMSQASVPEVYKCEQCDPRTVDVAFAKAHQQRRRDAEARKALLQRSVRRHSQNQSNTQDLRNEEAESAQADDDLMNIEEGGSKLGQAGRGGSISRSRKPSQQLDLSNVKFSVEDSSAASTPGSAKSGRKRMNPKTGIRRHNEGMSTPRSITALREAGMPGIQLPGGRGERTDAEDENLDRIEAWHVEYTPIRENILSSKHTSSILNVLLRNHRNGSPLRATIGPNGKMLAPVAGKRVKSISLPYNGPGSRETTEKLEDTKGEAPSPNSSHNDEGIALSAIGNECLPIEIETYSLPKFTQKTYVRQISEMASASIFNALLQMNVSSNLPQRSTSASRLFSKPVMHGLFADTSIPAGCFIMEYRGEVYDANLYRSDPINQYRMMGATKPCAHILPPPLNLCIDGRKYGNMARFARFSCHPNAVLRPILLRKKRSNSVPQPDYSNEMHSVGSPDAVESDETEIAFGLFSLYDISRSHEITVGWEWDDHHIVHMLPQLVNNPILGVLDFQDVAALSSTNPRLWDRETRNSAISTLVEKGDFPYADTDFSAKMNSIMTVLLSSCLCACIGSASAPNSGGSASSNNVKRQDCAIVQMLRLSQGMGLLNVNLPIHKSNRKSRVPDFDPLVGRRRWWRPDIMPSTPPEMERNVEEDEQLRNLPVPYVLAPGGKVARVKFDDIKRMIQERDASPKATEMIASGKDQGSSGMQDGNDDTQAELDDSVSVASSATEALDILSGEEDGVDQLTRLDGEHVMIARDGHGAFLVHTALPPKKRISGTRLKAVSPGVEGGNVEYRGKKKRRTSSTDMARVPKRHKVVRNGSDRLTRDEPDSNDDEEEDGLQIRRRASKSRRKSKAVDPSSPLSTAPSDVTDNADSDGGGYSSSATEDLTVRRSLKGQKGRIIGDDDDEEDEEDEEEEDDDEDDDGDDDGDDDDEEDEMSVQDSKERVRKRKRLDAQSTKKRSSKASAERMARRKELLGDFLDDSESSDSETQQQLGHESHTSMSPAKVSTKLEDQKDQSIVEDDNDGQSAFESTILDNQTRSLTPSMDQSEVNPFPVPIIPPPPPIEVPKAKLSLADYKKRLAERRSSSQAGQMTPLVTPTYGAFGSPEKPSLPGTPLDTPTPGSAGALHGGFNFPVPIAPTAIASSSAITRNVPTSMNDSTSMTIKQETVYGQPISRSNPLRSASPPKLGQLTTLRESETGKFPAPLSDGNPIGVSTASIASVKPSQPITALPNALTLTFVTTQNRSVSQGSFDSSMSEKDMSNMNILQHQDGSSSLTDPEVHESSKAGSRAASTTISLTKSAQGPAEESQEHEDQKTMADNQSSSISFNPPRGPKALINSSATPSLSVLPSASNDQIATVETQTVQSSQSPSRPRQDSTSLDSEVLPSGGHHGTNAANNILTSNLNGSKDTSLASPVSSSGHTASNSLNDFANVPKGPARMRERDSIRDSWGRDRGDWDQLAARNPERSLERDQAERGDRDWDRLDRMERIDRMDRLERIERMERMERMDRMDRLERERDRDREMFASSSMGPPSHIRGGPDYRDSRSRSGEWERDVRERETSAGYVSERDYGSDYGAYDRDRARRMDEDRYDRMGDRSYSGGRAPVSPYDRPSPYDASGPPNAGMPPVSSSGSRPGPPYGSSSRGGFGRGGVPWAGRARTRGRGSRGAWR